jgi:starvation-inducible DNA-binding protein
VKHTPEIKTLDETLQVRLAALLDLGLTLKHVHWNVVGSNFISVHEMLDDFVDKVRPMADEVAERIRTLGGVPCGTPQRIIDSRHWSDYGLGREMAQTHLEELHEVYEGVIDDHRKAIAQAGEIDPVTEGLLIDQTAELELMQWFVHSFLEHGGGDRSRFGFPDREPTRAESAAASRAEMGDETAQKYKEMAEVGAHAQGEGRI